MRTKATILGVFANMLCLSAQDQLDSLKNQVIDEVIVTGTRNEVSLSSIPVTVSIVNREEINHTQQASLLPVLNEYVPGLFCTSRGTMGYGVSAGSAGAISIRGLKGANGEVMVLIDGHPQYMGIMGHPLADVYQTMLAERIEVVSGPASVLYGSNAMGGVINIITRKKKEDGVNTNINVGYGLYNTLQTEITNQFRKKRFSSTISASYNRSDGHRENMDYQQYGGYARLNFDISDNWETHADVNVTHIDANNPGSVNAPLVDAKQSVTRGISSLSLQNKYEKTEGNISFFVNWGRHWLNDGYTVDTTDKNDPKMYRFDSHDKLLGISASQAVRFFKGNKTTFGMDWYHTGGIAQNTFVEGPEEGDHKVLVDKFEDEITGYVDFRQDIQHWLSLEAGIRVDHHSEIGTEWIPQAGLAFHMPHKTDLKLSATKGFRFPTIKDMYFGGAANPDLQSESMWNYELGFSQKLIDNKLTYGIQVFYIDGKDIITTVPVDGKSLNMNTGEIKNAGVEANVNYHISEHWAVNTNYSFLHMKNPIVASPEHKLNVGGRYMHPKWSLGANLQYVANLYTSVGKTETTENFVLLNLRAEWKATKWLDVWAKGENLLAQEYEINAGYPMPKATAMLGLNFHF